MKAENLKIMKANGINVPDFITVRDGESMDLSFGDRFAVRSSFIHEDSSADSHAGQFDTFLNVDKKDVAEAVRKVRQGYQEKCRDKAVGDSPVIVQKMVDADYSGILFTANPMGILNEMVIVHGRGLGNNVVEDRVDTTTYYYNRDDGLYYYEAQADSPKLEGSTLQNLIDVAKQIEALFQNYMDIEFALKDGVLFILQARPITTLDASHPIILDNSNIVESYPGITLPLTQDFVKEIYYKIFKCCILRISKDKELVESMDDGLKDMVETVNGRVYYRISNWYMILNLLPFSKKIIAIWQDMLGVDNRSVSVCSKKVKVRTKLCITHSFLHYLRTTPKNMGELKEYFDRQLPLYQKQVDSAQTMEELLGVYEAIRDSLVERWDITLINDMYAFIYTALVGKRNKERIADIKNLESLKPVMGIYELSEAAGQYGFYSEEYQSKKRDYIEKYGDRCFGELKLETQTYRANPELLDAHVKKKLGTNGKTEGRITLPPENRDVRGIFARRARLGIANREISRMNRTRIFGITRSIMLKCGELLANQNKLARKEDVFYLFMEELKENDRSFLEIVEERKAKYRHLEKLPAFGRLVFDKEIIHKTFQDIMVAPTNHKLCGIGSSMGRVTGEVVVIESPSMDIDTKDKIIVTKMTDPGWVFLIENALGIIAEKGSILSHTAIITRELHKPSIVNVKDATRILKSGDRIEMDAYSGSIKIIGD